MSLQEPGPGESFATDVTFVTEVVSENVHGKSWGADIHLVTNVARLGVLLGESFVSLTMS